MAFLTGGILDFLSQIREKTEGGGTFSRTTSSLEAISVDKIGAKDDAAAMNTTLYAGQQAIYDSQTVPSADSTDNDQMGDVVGNKTDAAVEAVGTTKSITAYSKGLVQELAQRAVAKMTGAYLTSSTLSDVLNITDKGVLTGFFMREIGTDNCYFAITVDGTVIYNASLVAVDAHTNSFTIAFNHRFNTSLRVQIKNSDNSTGMTGFVAYTVDA